MRTQLVVRGGIFDFDGPICDSHDKGIETIKTRLAPSRNIQVTDETLDTISYEWGLKGYELLSTCLGVSQEEGERMYREWNEHESGDNQPGAVLGAIEALTSLKERGMVLAMLTSRPAWSLNPWMHHVGLRRDVFRHIGTTCKSKFHKPHPRSFSGTLRVMKNEGISPGECIFVGDTHVDWKAGQARGITTFIVQTGPFGRHPPSRWEIEIPEERIIPSIAHLPRRLEELGYELAA